MTLGKDVFGFFSLSAHISLILFNLLLFNSFLPVHHTRPVQVLNSQHQLPDVLLRLPLVQALLVVDAVHEVAAGTQLHHQVVAVLRLQDVQQLRDVGVADHLLDVALPPQVLGHVRVLLGLPLVYHLDCHLERVRQDGGKRVRWTFALDKALTLRLKFDSLLYDIVNNTRGQLSPTAAS